MLHHEDSRSYYSVLDGVHHTEEACPTGRLVPPEFRREGTGGLALCPGCRARIEGRQRLAASVN
jgi:hypothetical protein